MFYDNYVFHIRHAASPVTVTGSAANQDSYRQGDVAIVDVELSNSGGARDVLVRTTVKRYGSGETVDGLPLRTLNNLAGKAALSLQWDTGGHEPGYYFVDVTVEDVNGDVLANSTEMFRVGIYSAEITRFSATPRYFETGDEIGVSLALRNTGSVDLAGTAVVKAQNAAGETVRQFRHDVANLAPGNTTTFDDSWDTSGVADGSYGVIGYVSYDSQATDLVTAEVSTGQSGFRVHLPVGWKN